MNVIIKPSKLSGVVLAPPSKSVAHRMLICAALAEGTSVISGIFESQDILATIDCLRELGADISVSDSTATVTGFAHKIKQNPEFLCRESGSTLRFLIPIALALCEKCKFSGTERLISRGIGIYKDILSNKNIKISENLLSFSFLGKLSGGHFYVPGNISSQFVSGLLLAAPLTEGNSSISVIPPVESRPYIDLTVAIMQSFGIKIENTSDTYTVFPSKYSPKSLTVEGDWSNSAIYFALNSLNSDITVSGLLQNSLQGDKIVSEHIKSLDTLSAKIDLSDSPDLAPVLFALAAIKNGAYFTGTKRLKIKESDRASAMRDELLKFGISCEIGDNFVDIPPQKLKKPTEALSSHNDHRIVMALTLLSSVTGGEISGFEAIQKSYPNFLEDLKMLGLEASYGA